MPAAVWQVWQEQRAELQREGDEILARCAADGNRQPTDEENTRLDAIQADRERLQQSVDRAMANERRDVQRQLEIVEGREGQRTTDAENPWRNFGEFLQAVASAHSPSGAFEGAGRVDPRLFAEPAAAASGLSSGVASDGGFLVRRDFTTELIEGGFAEAIIAPMCRRIPIGEGADGLEAPIIDQTSRANGSRWGGVQVYRRAEADTVAATKPKFGLFDLRLEDLMGICYATDRSLRDAVQLQSIITMAYSEEFAFKIDNEIVRGTGVGEMLGVTVADATVEQAKEAGQAAATIVHANLSKMWARMHARARGGAVWFYNQDIEPTMDEMSIPAGTGALEPRVVTLSESGEFRIKGRRALAIEQASTLGTVGDIFVMDPREYIIIEKDGLQAEQSIHVRFLYGERTFRFITRINGRPRWHSALTPANGSNTQSAYVTLATRA